MSTDATGTVVRTPTGKAVRIERVLAGSVEDVWASLTEPARLERWIGTWTPRGDEPVGPGSTVLFTMTAEDDAEPEEATVVTCDAPTRLAVDFVQDDGTWHVEVTLSEHGGGTRLVFEQSIGPAEETLGMGPGWEYYLDRLVAARTDAAMPDWDDYYPHQQTHWEDAAAQA